MRKFGGSEEAVSPVIGVVLMVGLTVIMISAVAVSVLAFTLPESAPQAKIVVVEAKGNITVLYKNHIILRHKGGDALFENDTSIIIRGRGYAYTGTDTGPLKDIRVTYRDLTGNNYGGLGGINLGEIVEGTSWDAGETITLYGKDGTYMGTASPQNNTVDYKWKLHAGSTVVITVIDIPSNQVIANSRAIVKQAS